MFLRTILKGGADKSYGLEVARLAGLPKEILLNGKKVLRTLEQRKRLIEKTISVEQLSLFGVYSEQDEEELIVNNRDEVMEDVIFEFENKDINNMTPIEALRFLADIKVKIEEIK
jgi:DNA mismatch repair protein MutS